MITHLLAAAVALLLSTCRAQDAVGREIAPWQPGTMDIHQISTGRGNAALYIFPDGTTMVVDAGEIQTLTQRHTGPRPDGSRKAGEWVVRYIRHALRHDPQPALDYALLTHFHGDHMGEVAGGVPDSRSGVYKLAGITRVGEELKIGKLLDRGWPDYRYPAPVDDAHTKNYRAFAHWQADHNGVKVERFQPGRNDQVVLRRDPKKYPSFDFRNVGANGEVWTGVASTTRNHFPLLDSVPQADWPTENMCSISFRLSFGKFDFFSGGDMPGIPMPGCPQWHDIETPVAKAVGPVEAAILDHHGYIDSMNEFLIAALRPRIWTISVWDSGHPTSAVWNRLQSKRLYPGPREVYATDVHTGVRSVINGIGYMGTDHGHIVIRVGPGGDQFRVVVVDDASESHRVIKVAGPYESR